MMTLYNNPQSRGLTLLPLLKELEIEIRAYLRDEKTFPSAKELANQIKKDITHAKHLLCPSSK